MPRSSDQRPLSSQQTKDLEQLQRRLSDFRRSHPSRSKIPRPLVQAALDLLAAGVSQTHLIRTCKLSSSLIHRWKQSQATKPASILSVIDEPIRSAEPRRSPSSLLQHADLTFCIGGWTVHLRMEPPPCEKVVERCYR